MRTLRQVFQFGESSPAEGETQHDNCHGKTINADHVPEGYSTEGIFETDIRDRSQYGSHEQQDKWFLQSGFSPAAFVVQRNQDRPDNRHKNGQPFPDIQKLPQ